MLGVLAKVVGAVESGFELVIPQSDPPWLMRDNVSWFQAQHRILLPSMTKDRR